MFKNMLDNKNIDVSLNTDFLKFGILLHIKN